MHLKQNFPVNHIPIFNNLQTFILPHNIPDFKRMPYMGARISEYILSLFSDAHSSSDYSVLSDRMITE